jgi:hypothetical protein
MAALVKPSQRPGTESCVVSGIDTIGGEVRDRSFDMLRTGGVVVSAVGQPDQDKAAQRGVRAVFFLVAVSSGGLIRITFTVDIRTPMSRATFPMIRRPKRSPGRTITRGTTVTSRGSSVCSQPTRCSAILTLLPG